MKKFFNHVRLQGMKAIITDYDYTLSEKFMTVELLRLLEKLKVTESGYSADYENLRNLYHAGEVNYNDFVKNDMIFIRKYLKGVEHTKVLEVIRQDLKPEANIFTWAKEIRKIFNKEEWMFIVISSTMGSCLEYVQEYLDFDTYLASSYEVKGGVYTGEFSCQVKKEEKANYVKALKPSFEKIVVIGDAPGDFGMLELADHAFLFEPKEKTLVEAEGLNFKVVNRDDILKNLKTLI